MAKKDVGVIIKFDEKECSDEERDLLWGRLALFLAEAHQELKGEKLCKMF